MKDPRIIEENGQKFIEVEEPSIFHRFASVLAPSMFARVEFRHVWVREPDGSKTSGRFYVVHEEDLTKIFPKSRSHPALDVPVVHAGHAGPGREPRSDRFLFRRYR